DRRKRRDVCARVFPRQRLSRQQRPLRGIGDRVSHAKDVAVGRWKFPRIAGEDDGAERRHARRDRRAPGDESAVLHLQPSLWLLAGLSARVEATAGKPTVIARIWRQNPDATTMTR